MKLSFLKSKTIKHLAIGFVLGWVLNIASREYRDFLYADLEVDALDMGFRRFKGEYTIDDYVKDRMPKIFEYINYRPDLWTCRFMYGIERCPIKSLIRRPIPEEQRPKR